MTGLTKKGAARLMDGPPTVENFDLPLGFRWSRRENVSRSFANIAFKDVRVEPYFGREAIFRACSFRDVAFDGPRFRKARFLDCRFEHVDVGRGLMGFMDHCSFERCVFVSVRLRGLQIMKTRFVSTSFDAVDLERVVAKASSFSDLVIRGRWASVTLVDCLLDGLDASAATIEDLGIVGGGQEKVVWPSRDSNFAVPPSSLRAVSREVMPNISHQAREAFEETVRVLGESRMPVLMISRSFFEGMTSDDAEFVMRALRRFAIKAA